MSLFQPLELTLPKYFGKGKGKVNLKPSETLGVNINGVDINATSLCAVKHWTTARFLEIEGNTGKVSVVEHLLSALRAAGLTHVDVDIKAGFVPVIGPGIEPVFSMLDAAEKQDVGPICTKQIKNREEFEFGSAKMIVEPSDTFDLHIQTNHPDLVDIGAEPLSVMDVTSSITDYLTARPIARLQSPLIKGAHTILSKNPILPLKGIGGDSYIMTKPGDSGDDIVSQMQPEYQEGRNEHLYHTMTADFLGELASFFPGEFKGKITLLNTNHTSRVALLRQLYLTS